MTATESAIQTEVPFTRQTALSVPYVAACCIFKVNFTVEMPFDKE